MVMAERFWLEAKPRRSQSPELPPTAAVAGVVSPSRARAEKAEVETGPSIRMSQSPAQSRQADRCLFAATFHGFCGTSSKLSACGFTKLCKQCFLLTETFTSLEAAKVFWEVLPPDAVEMDLCQFEAALAQIASSTGRCPDTLRRAVVLAGGPTLPASCAAARLKEVPRPRLPAMPANGGA
mmetsp:Transcript_74780/g.178478  ORF Transcript_74780/g.178478 Transcript_74780/m.178478 type:complete len:181 (+) Transcript_74780:65-607(+)